MAVRIRREYTTEILAVVPGQSLARAALAGHDLRGACLRQANLSAANLEGADLRGADLFLADLRGASLAGADLRGASLVGARLRGTDLTAALWDTETLWPFGFRAPQPGESPPARGGWLARYPSLQRCDVCSGRLTAADVLFSLHRRGRLTYPVESLANPGHERPILLICHGCREWAAAYRRSRASPRPGFPSPGPDQSRANGAGSSCELPAAPPTPVRPTDRRRPAAQSMAQGPAHPGSCHPQALVHRPAPAERAANRTVGYSIALPVLASLGIAVWVTGLGALAYAAFWCLALFTVASIEASALATPLKGSLPSLTSLGGEWVVRAEAELPGCRPEFRIRFDPPTAAVPASLRIAGLGGRTLRATPLPRQADGLWLHLDDGPRSWTLLVSPSPDGRQLRGVLTGTDPETGARLRARLTAERSGSVEPPVQRRPAPVDLRLASRAATAAHSRNGAIPHETQ
jgi:hypothetical protein